MRYVMMRLFLTRRIVPPLLDRMQEPRTPVPRSDYLMDVLGAEVRFSHHGSWLTYRLFHVLNGKVLAGVVGRPRTQTIGLPPEQEFRHEDIPDWETANVFVDTSGDADGQKAAMQTVQQIGQPLAVFRSLIDHVNDARPDSDWVIAVNAITNEEEFWQAVERHAGSISEIDLTFVPPNIWGAQSETEKALKELNTEDNATEVEIKIKNKDKKLKPKSKRIKQSVEYISKGGGRSRIKKAGKTVFDSEHKIATQDVTDDKPVQEAETQILLRLARLLFPR